MELIKEKFGIMLKKDDALQSIGMGQMGGLVCSCCDTMRKNALPAHLAKKN